MCSIVSVLLCAADVASWLDSQEELGIERASEPPFPSSKTVHAHTPLNIADDELASWASLLEGQPA